MTLANLITLMYPCKHRIVTELKTEWYESQDENDTNTAFIMKKRHHKNNKIDIIQNPSFTAYMLYDALKNVKLRAELDGKLNTVPASEQIV